jgi:hypothetical protein
MSARVLSCGPNRRSQSRPSIPSARPTKAIARHGDDSGRLQEFRREIAQRISRSLAARPTSDGLTHHNFHSKAAFSARRNAPKGKGPIAVRPRLARDQARYWVTACVSVASMRACRRPGVSRCRSTRSFGFAKKRESVETGLPESRALVAASTADFRDFGEFW